MHLSPIRTLLSVPVVLFPLFFLPGAFMVAIVERAVYALEARAVAPEVIAVFGASGTAGDGI